MGSKIFLRKYRVSAEEIGAVGEPGYAQQQSSPLPSWIGGHGTDP